ncbi:alkaline phosphatase D family protein [Prauserella shujinwangii]|uniref:alkaline phosphatase D family protein n=1 Tax=Prauserella shujinwangii TaxID=1453103 RepID=UPI001FEABEA0|nr:alkaline phosphatase D family protein [Prauserella shujinwangii]
MSQAELVLGPLLRHVDATSATVWVETSAPCEVAVEAGTAGARAPTFEVSGHHYALVVLTGLEPAASLPYTVRLDGRAVWPEPDSRFPASRIRTLPTAGGALFRLLCGSCRQPNGFGALGSDALEAYAERMARQPEDTWPQALLLLGDQVYADETTVATRRWLAGRRDLRRAPGSEVTDFEEYAHLYRETWGDPAMRWLISTLPVSMIFDDHDVRDDWNTSEAWRERMRRQPWWEGRLRAAFMSYWVYQHLGNLGPAELADDPTVADVLGGPGDRAEVLRELADRADHELDGRKDVRWSYRRQFGRVRLLVIDSRAGRILGGGRRSMLDEDEFRWVEDNAVGDHDHLLIGSSLPWLLPPAFSHLESANERACTRPGRRGRFAEWIRQAADLEHWAAFRDSFDRLSRLIVRIGQSRDAPATVSVLSGDVHHSYVAGARFPWRLTSAVFQLTCSPLHNKVPWYLRGVLRAGWWSVAERLARRWSRWAGVEPPEVEWSRTTGPHFGNAVLTLELAGRRAEAILECARPEGLVEQARLPLAL